MNIPFFYFFLIMLIMFMGVVSHNSVKRQKQMLNIVIIMLILISGLRKFTIGNDTITYINLFKNINIFSIQELSDRYEIGFILLVKLIRSITADPQIFLFIISIIFWLNVRYFVKELSPSYWISCFLLITFGYLGGSFNALRHELAISFIMVAFVFLCKKKIIFYTIFTFIAFSFHQTAIAFFIMIPLQKIQLTKKFKLITMLLTIFSYIGFQSVLDILMKYFPRFQYYIGSEYLNGEIRVASIFNTLLIIVILGSGVLIEKYLATNKIKNENQISIVKKMMFLSIALGFLSFKFNLLGRVQSFFSIVVLLYIPYICKGLKRKEESVLYFILMSFCFICYFTTIIVFRPEWNHINPYLFFWQ